MIVLSPSTSVYISLSLFKVTLELQQAFGGGETGVVEQWRHAGSLPMRAHKDTLTIAGT